MDLSFKNILVIDLGQLGDVVLSLPALRAVRERFSDAKITLLVGKATADVVRIAGAADELIVVDRVALRDGGKAASIAEIFRIVRDVRRQKYDFVLDLHSLYETNLLGYLSGARYRLFANRENRSFDRLANFPEKPPREDKGLHHTDRYFEVLKPLGIERSAGPFRLEPGGEEREKVAKVIERRGLSRPQRVGLFLGAGHPGRRWGVDKFARLAMKVFERGDANVLVFAGPEEADLRAEAEQKLSQYAAVIEPMQLPTFIAMLERLDTFVSTDTGPMHLAAVAGSSIVLITQTDTPDYFFPLTDSLRIVHANTVGEVSVDDVYQAVAESLTAK